MLRLVSRLPGEAVANQQIISNGLKHIKDGVYLLSAKVINTFRLSHGNLGVTSYQLETEGRQRDLTIYYTAERDLKVSIDSETGRITAHQMQTKKGDILENGTSGTLPAVELAVLQVINLFPACLNATEILRSEFSTLLPSIKDGVYECPISESEIIKISPVITLQTLPDETRSVQVSIPTLSNLLLVFAKDGLVQRQELKSLDGPVDNQKGTERGITTLSAFLSLIKTLKF